MLPPIVEESAAKDYAVQMSKPDLVFLTKENEAKVRERIAPHVKAEIEKQEAVAREKATAEKRRIDDALSKPRR